MQHTRKAALASAMTSLMALSGEAGAVVSDAQYRALERRLQLLEQRLSQAENGGGSAKPAPNKPANSEETLAPVGAGTPASSVQAGDETRDELKKLKQKVGLLERQQEIAEENRARVAKEVPKIDAGSGGFKWSSPDGEHALRLGGYIQADGDFFADDNYGTPWNANQPGDKFWVRRGRIVLDGQLFRYVNFRLMPDFAQGQTRLFDGWVDLHYFNFASFTAGKMKAPINLERLQSATAIQFVERAYPTQLAPNRDVGYYLHGEIAKPGYELDYQGPHNFRDWITYGFGVFDGTPDNGFTDTSQGDNVSYMGRVFAHPFQHSGVDVLEGFGLGFGGSYDNANRLGLQPYVSVGQQQIVTFTPTSVTTTQAFVPTTTTIPSATGGRPTTVVTGGSIQNTTTSVAGAVANGDGYRLQPQAYWYWNAFHLMAEYAVSNQHLANAITNSAVSRAFFPTTSMTNTAWQINGSWVLTGETPDFNRGVRPRHIFDPFAGTWGAFQIAARWTQLDIDNDIFQNSGTLARPVFPFSDPRTSVSSAKTWGVDLSWYLNNNVRLIADYEQTYFKGGGTDLFNPTVVTSRPMERVFMTRVQVAW